MDTMAFSVDSSTICGIESINFQVNSSDATATVLSSKTLTRRMRASPLRSSSFVASRYLTIAPGNYILDTSCFKTISLKCSFIFLSNIIKRHWLDLSKIQPRCHLLENFEQLARVLFVIYKVDKVSHKAIYDCQFWLANAQTPLLQCLIFFLIIES